MPQTSTKLELRTRVSSSHFRATTFPGTRTDRQREDKDLSESKQLTDRITPGTFKATYLVIQSRTMEDIKKEITEATKKMEELYNVGRFDEHYDVYTDDVKMMPAGSDVIVGREAVKAMFALIDRSDIGRVVNTVDEVVGLGGHAACALGHATSYKANGTIYGQVTFVNLWKKIDGEWKLYANIFNSI